MPEGADGPLDVIAYDDDEFGAVPLAGHEVAVDSEESGSDLRHILEKARLAGKGDGWLAPPARPVDVNYLFDDDTGVFTVTNNPLADPEIVRAVSLSLCSSLLVIEPIALDRDCCKATLRLQHQQQ